MFNPLNIFSSLIKSGNEKELSRIQKIVDKVNLLEKNLEDLSDDDFPKKTQKLIEEVQKGKEGETGGRRRPRRSRTTSSAARAAWRSPRRSRATPPSRDSGLLPCRQTHSPIPCGCTFPRTQARRRLRTNGLGDDAEQALRAAAGSGLELHL